MPSKSLDNPFELLPDAGYWVVVAWGRVVNTGKGNYKINVILRKIPASQKASPFDLSRFTEQVTLLVDLGSIRAFSPGTVFFQREVAKYIHNHVKKVKIDLPNPQALDQKRFKDVFGLGSGNYYPLFDIDPTIENCPVRVFKSATKHGDIIFPCSVIADYYYFGEWRMIKYILEGKIDSLKRHKNGLYNPTTLTVPDPDVNEKLGVITLRREMTFNDELKIARIAFDSFYRDTCLAIATGLLRAEHNESFIKTDFPIEKPTKLSVYGSSVNTNAGKAFLVHSISFCTSPMPFNGLLVGREDDWKNPSKTDSESGKKENDPEKLPDGSFVIDRTGRDPNTNPKKTRKGKPISEKPPLYNSAKQQADFEKEEAFNFSKDNILRARELDQDGTSKKLKKFKKRFKIFDKLSTNPDLGSDPNIGKLSLRPGGLFNTKNENTEDYFNKIQIIRLAAENHYMSRHKVSGNLVQPYPIKNSKFSSFDLKRFENRDNETQEFYDMKLFCYIKPRFNGFTEMRRVYIAKLLIDTHYFYLLDVEPKYSANSAVIIYSPTDLTKTFKLILDQMVNTCKKKGSIYNVLDQPPFSLVFKRFNHYSNTKASLRNIQDFIDGYLL